MFSVRLSVSQVWGFLLQGRNPFFLEPAIIIAISDGNKLTSSSGVQEEVSLGFLLGGAKARGRSNVGPGFSPSVNLQLANIKKKSSAGEFVNTKGS